MNDDKKTASLEETRKALRVINGLDDTDADILFEAGFYQPADLLPYTPEALVQVVQARVQKTLPLARMMNENWLEQARSSAEKAWKQRAGFMLFFEEQALEGAPTWRTRIYHHESKIGEDPTFSISRPDTWANWIIEQADLPVTVPRVVMVTKVANAADLPQLREEHMEIQHVEVEEVARTAVFTEKQLMTSVRFRVTAEDAIEHKTPYRIDVHVVDLETNHTHRVASAKEQLDPTTTIYYKQLRFPLPQVGRYELHTIVLLLPPYEMMTFYQGPRITIVP